MDAIHPDNIGLGPIYYFKTTSNKQNKRNKLESRTHTHTHIHTHTHTPQKRPRDSEALKREARHPRVAAIHLGQSRSRDGLWIRMAAICPTGCESEEGKNGNGWRNEGLDYTAGCANAPNAPPPPPPPHKWLSPPPPPPLSLCVSVSVSFILSRSLYPSLLLSTRFYVSLSLTPLCLSLDLVLFFLLPPLLPPPPPSVSQPPSFSLHLPPYLSVCLSS